MKKIFTSVILSFISVFIFFGIVLFIQIYVYYNNQIQNTKLINREKAIEYYNENKNSLYNKTYELLLPRLLINNFYSKDGKINFVKIDPNNSYVIPEIALEKSDILIGYGIGPHIFLENKYTELYQKQSYGFDCGVTYDEIKKQITEKNCHFYSECISTDKFLMTAQQDPEYGKNQISSGKIHSFGEKIKDLNLQNKKIFIKMDIVGAEYEVIPDIINYAENITGISIVIHLDTNQDIIKAIKILKLLEKDFILVSRNNSYVSKETNLTKRKYVKGILRDYIALSYVNKKLAKKTYMPLNQKSITKPEFKGIKCNIDDTKYIYVPYSNISVIVVLAEKLNKILKIDYN